VRLTQYSVKTSRQVMRSINGRKNRATPTLSMQPQEPNPLPPKARPQPILEDDDSDDAADMNGESRPMPTKTRLSPDQSQPLQEISPNLSPKKLDASQERKSTSPFKKQSSPNNLNSPGRQPLTAPDPSSPKSSQVLSLAPSDPDHYRRPRLQKELTANLAELIERHSASRAPTAEPPPRRKHRPLGRNLSGTSNRSTSASAGCEEPASVHPSQLAESEANGFRLAIGNAEPPSTQLHYEAPEAEAVRAQLSKRLGAAIDDEQSLRRVPGLEMVKDSGGMAGTSVGSRLRDRHRGR
jgi:DNA replication regulator DPB11